jgi:hypothetical protein
MKLPQLSLRELFLLVALAAMGCGWWIDRWQLQHSLESENLRLVYEIDDLKRKVRPEWPDEPGEWIHVTAGERGAERIRSGIGPPEF